MGKGSTTIQAPDPVNPGQAQGEYLFGPNFGSFEGVTDPRLQQRLLGAESAGRQAYTGLELRDIGTMARGLEAGQDNPEYQRIQSEIAALEAGGQASGRLPNKKELETEAAKRFPMTSGRDRRGYPVNRGRVSSKQRKAIEAQRANYIEQRSGGRDARSTARAEELASLRSRLANTPQTLDKTAGLFDLLEESSIRAGDLQRRQLGQQRADDVAALQRFAPQVVQAYRDADPESTRLAEMASARAGRDTGLGARGQELLGSQVQAASAAERALQGRGMSDVNARREAASAAEIALQGRGLSDINARREAASAAERQLQEMGMTLGDLSPTEQEALISARGSEFIQSTGELSPLEQRRAQQSARQGSLARGREMGQGSLYDEMLARQAEELNKEERQVALGSQLLGQEAGMRGARLGQGAGMLQGSEALAAQRRLEQLQRQQFGSQNLAQVNNMAAQRRAEQLQRQMFGTQTLNQSENLAARRRAEQLQRMQLGAGFIGQEEGIQSGRFGQAFGMNRALAGDAGNIILGRPSAAIGLGQQTLGQAQAGAAGPMGPQLFDPNVGINMAMQNQANQFGLLGAQAQADAARSAGGLGAFGSILGGAFSGGLIK